MARRASAGSARYARRRSRLRGRRWAVGVAAAVLGVTAAVAFDGLARSAPEDPVEVVGTVSRPELTETPSPDPSSSPDPSASAALRATVAAALASEQPSVATPPPTPPAIPAGSGSGHRIVYDLSDQRVWLVDAAEQVTRTYLVSGGSSDEVAPGSYAVFSRSEAAVSYRLTETMRLMVRFTYGREVAIGFHDIPLSVANGQPVQTEAQLGQRLSDGCVRQSAADAQALWDFAPVGTAVVVTV